MTSLSEYFFKYYDLPTRFFVKPWKDFYARQAVKFYAAALAVGDKRGHNELENLSSRRALDLMRYARKYVLRWQELDMDLEGVNLSEFRNSWRSLPVTSKLDYKNAPGDNFLSRHPHFSYHRKDYFTSGTTGSPLNFYYEHYRYEIHHGAALYYALKKIGALNQGKRVSTTFATVFLGDFFPLPMAYDLIDLDLSYPDETASAGRRSFEKFFNKLSSVIFDQRPVLIMRPSQALLFAHWLDEFEKELKLPFIVLVGENLVEDQRQYIERAFHCLARMIYSTKELSIMGYECPSNLGYIHIFPETHLIEIQDHDSMVITSFINLTMPFIRYDIGDRAFIKSVGRCSCSSSRPLLKILGRDNQFIKLKNKTVSFITLDYLLCQGRSQKIKQLQFIRNSSDSFTLKIAATPLFTKMDELRMLTILKDTLFREISVKFEYLDFIPPEPSGKFINFKSLI